MMGDSLLGAVGQIEMAVAGVLLGMVLYYIMDVGPMLIFGLVAVAVIGTLQRTGVIGDE